MPWKIGLIMKNFCGQCIRVIYHPVTPRGRDPPEVGSDPMVARDEYSDMKGCNESWSVQHNVGKVDFAIDLVDKFSCWCKHAFPIWFSGPASSQNLDMTLGELLNSRSNSHDNGLWFCGSDSLCFV
jgi:hypothetical protein